MIFKYQNGYGDFYISITKNRTEMLDEIRKIDPQAPDSAEGGCVVLYRENLEKRPWIYLNEQDIAGNDFVVEHEAGHCALRLMQLKDPSFKRSRRLTRDREEDFLMLQGGVAANIYEALLDATEPKKAGGEG